MSTCTASVTQEQQPAAHTGGPIVAVSGTAPGTLTLTLDGGRSAQTPSGDYAGDLVLTCDAGTELKSPWWVRIDRKATP